MAIQCWGLHTRGQKGASYGNLDNVDCAHEVIIGFFIAFQSEGCTRGREWAFYDNLILCPAHKRPEEGFVQCSWCNHEVKWELSMAIQHIGSFLYEVRRGLYQILGPAHIRSGGDILWQSETGNCTYKF